MKFCSRSGSGGAGSAHFRREKFVPKGGPDGGDGGRGGHIMLRGNRQYWTLLHLKYQKHVIAENGAPGAGARKKGRDGGDIVLEVPLGTVARDAETGAVKVEITRHDQLEILTPGGRGGLGNDHFKTATNQSPRYAQPGEPGKEEWVVLELKLLADVGLVGFPNAGKSTLLSVLSAARPEIADYPFTTLTPNLGVVDYKGYKSFVMADIPGLIEGASQGRGLGHRFLRHIERNSVLLFMIPCDTRDILGDYHILLDELQKYNPELLDKERVVAITKVDMLDGELQQQMLEELPADFKVHFISSITGQGIEPLKNVLWAALNRS